jgi:hypothetical protein
MDKFSIEWQQAGYDNGNSQIPLPNDIVVIEGTLTASQLNEIIANPSLEGGSTPSENNIVQIQLEPGEYLFDSPIEMQDFVILKGNHMFRRDSDEDDRTIIRFDLSDSNDNCIEVNNKVKTGIEDIKIIREGAGPTNNEDSQGGHNICIMNNSTNCWVIGVESINPVKHHFDITESNKIQVQGCYFYGAQSFGEGGYGYGVICENGSYHCLIVNNVFRENRHAMLVQNSAHHNVFAYNFASGGKQNNSSLAPDDFTGDIVCHGETSYENGGPYRGPYENLFEGNIVDWMWVDWFHQSNKKYNTFFRNKSKDYGMMIFGWGAIGTLIETLFFIDIDSHQPKQNVVNNYLRCTNWFWSQVGLGRTFWGITPFEKNTIEKKSNFWGQLYTRTWTDNKYKKTSSIAWLDDSYYSENRPEFFLNEELFSFPFHPENDKTIPAKQRYDVGTKKTFSRYYDNNYYSVSYFLTNKIVPDDIPSELLDNNNLIVPKGIALYIGAGVTLEFREGRGMKVYGHLEAIGDVDDKIIFTNFENDEWKSISFYGSGNSVLRNCILENSEGSLQESMGGAIYIENNDEIIIEDCILRNNWAYFGGAITLNNSDVTIRNTIFEDNASNFSGGAIWSLNSSPTIVNNYFYYNYGQWGGAIRFQQQPSNSHAIVSGNIFYMNEASRAGAIGLYNVNSVILINNTFAYNSASNCGAVYCDDSHISSFNNIFWNNYGNNDNLQIKGIGSSSAKLYNNVISNASNSIDISVTHQTATYSQDPSFYSDGGDVLLIPSTSIAFDNGLNVDGINDIVDLFIEFPSTDINGNPRITASNVDIGACESYDRGIFLDDPELALGNVNPDNPLKGTLKIKNIHPVNSLNNISYSLEGDVANYMEISYCPTQIPASSYDYLRFNFFPTKMYQKIDGEIKINSDDAFFPEISIPVEATSGLHHGWNWVSFPSDSFQNADVYDKIDPFGICFASDEGYLRYNTSSDTWENDGLDILTNNNCYKIQMSNSSTAYDFSNLGAHPYTSKTLYPNQPNWIGYWRTNSQDLDEAFGDDFDKVISIKSENWYYGPLVNARDTSYPVTPSNQIHPLHFGRGYIVQVSETIENFNWNYSGSVFSKNAKDQVSNFSFTTQEDYKVIDVIGLEENDYEIGAFIDSTCVGAAVVEDNQAQILAYTDGVNRGKQVISFKVFSNNRSKSVEEYLIYNEKNNTFERSNLNSLNLDYNLISLSHDFSNNEQIPNVSFLRGNYPNPFNPTTSISFFVPEKSYVKISIYNIKGQIVKKLTSQEYDSGNHTLLWNGNNNENQPVSSGVYFYNLSIDGKIEDVKKCLLLK